MHLNVRIENLPISALNFKSRKFWSVFASFLAQFCLATLVNRRSKRELKNAPLSPKRGINNDLWRNILALKTWRFDVILDRRWLAILNHWICKRFSCLFSLKSNGRVSFENEQFRLFGASLVFWVSPRSLFSVDQKWGQDWKQKHTHNDQKKTLFFSKN